MTSLDMRPARESAAAFRAPDHYPRLQSALTATSQDVERVLDRLLPAAEGLHARVLEAMRYAIFAGGKRLRPFLLLESSALFGASREQALRAAAAIEAVHTYSLVHDDLPAMDDDDLRRGRPTTHRQFDEATAILAGDALLTLAFEIVADPATHPSAEVRIDVVSRLARAAGAQGMVGGQMMDIEAPNRSMTAEQIVDLQRRKTGALFEFCCTAGARLGGAGAADVTALESYARDFGLAFQIADDLIDVLGSTEQAGKQVGKDQEQGKATLVGLYGVEGAQAKVQELAERASETLAPYGPAADLLRALPAFLLDRQA